MKKELEPAYLKGRRLRLFGGPNGSGKSTIIELIRSSFDVGYYINPDEIEKKLSQKKSLDLKEFGIKAQIDAFTNFIMNHPLNRKVVEYGSEIRFTLEENAVKITNVDKERIN